MNWFQQILWGRRYQEGKFTELNPDSILKTIRQLEERILERFPESGLSRVCAEFFNLASETSQVAQELKRPIWLVRLASALAGLLLFGLAIWALTRLKQDFTLNSEGIHDILQSSESAINELILLGLAFYYLTNLEARLKRHTAMRYLHRLRSIAHVVDMHQLTKDPTILLNKYQGTAASPLRSLNRFELTRYLDYCSELLALDSKVAALLVQYIDDAVVLEAVNDLENLTQGLSAKIWQKIMILDLSLVEQNKQA